MPERIIEIVGPVGERATPRIPLAPGVEGNFNGVMAHRPDLMAGFFHLYLTLWTGGVLAAASDADTPAERAAIVFAGTMAAGARHVTDEMVRDLREHFSEPEIVELCVLVAMVGGFGSINVALDIGPDSPELQVFDPEAAARASAELGG